MEVDNNEEIGDQVWWSGSEPWHRDGWEVSVGVCQVNVCWRVFGRKRFSKEEK